MYASVFEEALGRMELYLFSSAMLLNFARKKIIDDAIDNVARVPKD